MDGASSRPRHDMHSSDFRQLKSHPALLQELSKGQLIESCPAIVMVRLLSPFRRTRIIRPPRTRKLAKCVIVAICRYPWMLCFGRVIARMPGPRKRC